MHTSFRPKLSLGMCFLALLASLLVSCQQPMATSGRHVSIDLSPAIKQMGQRSLGDITAVSITVFNQDNEKISEKTWDALNPDTPLEFDLETAVAYSLELKITRSEEGAPRSYIYKNSFTIPESGELNLEVIFPSVADWSAFQAVIDEIGQIMQWNGPTGPMSDTFAAAADSPEATGSGSTGNLDWAWDKSSGSTLVTLSFNADTSLGSTGYTIKSGSYQQFSESETVSCLLNWEFSSGTISQVEMEYAGTESSTVFSKVLVNGFDYKELFSLTNLGSNTGGLSSTQISAFMQNDLTASYAAFGVAQTALPGTAYAAVSASSVATTEPPFSGSGSSGNFSWAWARDASNNEVQTISTTASVPLPSPAATTLESGSVFTFNRPVSGGMNFSIDFKYAGGPVKRCQLIQDLFSYSLWGYSSFVLNDVDLSTKMLVPVTLQLNDGSAAVNTKQFVGMAIPVPIGRTGCDFGGWYTDSGLLTAAPAAVSGAISLYAKWVDRAPLVVFSMESGSTTASSLANTGTGGSAWNSSSATIGLSTGDYRVGAQSALFSGSQNVNFGVGQALPTGFTISLWAKPDNQAIRQVLFSSQTGYNYHGLAIAKDSSGFLHLEINTDVSHATTASSFIPNGSDWYHIVVIQSASGDFSMQVFDSAGTLIPSASGTHGAGSYAAGSSYSLGQYTGGTFPYSGLLDEVRIYDYAMSPAQVATIP